jgi:hypothetical protein
MPPNVSWGLYHDVPGTLSRPSSMAASANGERRPVANADFTESEGVAREARGYAAIPHCV